jgi:formylglycine-generating enzyme required for sulfatase activity
MVQVYIPAGEFTMGAEHARFVGSYPAHKVYLDAFWLDRTAVTNAMYARCVAAERCEYTYAKPGYNPGFSDPLFRDYPVTFVNWDEARRYCAWAGRRLPTEAEWEKAARGTLAILYPWGTAPPDISLLNFANNIGGTVSVLRYPRGASPYGVLQLEGNVREWTQDWFDPDYYKVSPYRNPQGPASGANKVLRGAAFDDNERQALVFIRFSHRPTSRGINRGFRCAESAGN